MRGIVGLTLTGIGAFFIALALLLRFFVAGQAIKFPLDQFSTTTFTGNNVSYFYFKQLIDVTGVKAQETEFFEGDVEAGSSSTAVWEEATSIQDETNFRTISSTARRSAFNRTTGALVNCCGEFVGGSTSVNQSGQGFLWPIGTQKQTYDVFDPATLQPEPFRYTGTATVDGRLTDEFVEQVSNQQIGTRSVPAFLVGGSANSKAIVSVPEFLSETTTVWVDPGSGIPVYEIQNQTQTIQSGGTVQLVLFQGTLTETPASAASAAATASSFDLRKELLKDILPLVSLLLGLAMLIAGVVLTGRRLQGERPDYEGEEAAGLPQYAENGYYQPGLMENGYRPELPAASYQPALPQAGPRWQAQGGYPPGQAETGYGPGQADAGYPPVQQEAGYQPGQPEEVGFWPGFPGTGYPAGQPEAGYPPAPPAAGYQSGQYQQAGYQQGQFQADDYQSGQFQQPSYQPQAPQNGYQAQAPQNGYQPQAPQNGYQAGPVRDDGYWNGSAATGYPVGPPETDYPTEPPQDVYQTEQFPEVNGTPEYPGRVSDGIPRILEPRPEQPRVGRHSRGGRDRAPGG
jgi:hypothetical protein